MNPIKTAIQRATNRIDAAEHVDVQRAMLAVEEARAELLAAWITHMAIEPKPDEPTWMLLQHASGFETKMRGILQSLLNRETTEIGTSLTDLAAGHQEFIADELRRAIGGTIAATGLADAEREELLNREIEGLTFGEYIVERTTETMAAIRDSLRGPITMDLQQHQVLSRVSEVISSSMKRLRESYGKTVGAFAAAAYQANADILLSQLQQALD